MRLLAILALACIARCAAAEDAFPVVLLDAKDAQGHRVQFLTDSKTMDDLPIWTPGSEDPPVSLEAASKIVYEAAMRQSPKAEGISFRSIRLLLKEFTYPKGKLVTWFWAFSVAPVVDDELQPPRDIVVLLSGKVVDPTPVK